MGVLNLHSAEVGTLETMGVLNLPLLETVGVLNLLISLWTTTGMAGLGQHP